MTGPTVAVIVVTYDSAGEIGETLEALAPQLGDGDELVVVDNASRDATLAEVRRAAPAARVLEMRDNLGFAGGCNAGAAASTAPLLIFLNPDSRPEPDAIAALRRTAGERPDWGAWQALVTLPDGLLNTRGGVVHYLGFAWAGGAGDPVPADLTAGEVAFASGAALAVRREPWERLCGFDESYFMYLEDVDLSLRLRLAGLGVGIAPDARVVHDYEFDKGGQKWFLLERNRWAMLVADYPLSLLLLLAPALAATELALLPAALAGGWLREKLRADVAVLRALPRLVRRRRAVGRHVTLGAREFADVLEPELTSRYLGRAAESALLRTGLRLYWRLVLACLTVLARRP